MRRLGVYVVIALAGCNPNFGGQGSSSAGMMSTSSDADTSDAGSATTAPPMTSGIMTSGGSMSLDSTSVDPVTTSPGSATETTDAETTDATTGPTTDPSEDTGEPMCPLPDTFSALVMAADATLEDPAELRPAWGGLSGEPMVAMSFVDDEGLIHFDFEIPCDGTYHVWGLVWDLHFGSGHSCGMVPNADSLFMFADGNEPSEQRWNWGCNSCSWSDQTWAWGRSAEYVTNPCETEDISYTWDAGMHRITFRNESDGWDAGLPDVAAIAAVVVSDDPGFDPNALYLP